jgi:thiol-disulfide isomerase/thioredoxin
MSKEIWYFYADWCPYCQQQNPIMDEYEAENPEVEIIRINEANDKDAVEHNQIESFPTLIVFKNGLSDIKKGLHSKEKLEELFA